MDNCATMALSKAAKTAYIKSTLLYGNASSLHSYGYMAKQAIEKAREQVASLISAKPQEIIFNSGGTEGNNTIINMIHDGEIIVSAIEHPSILEAAKRQASKGIKIHYLPVDKTGKIQLEELKKALNNKTRLVSIMMANNETGTLQDIPKIAAIARKAKALVHTDAVQAVGKIPVNIKKLSVDYLTLSAHKIGGSKGVGALYVREGAPYEPFLVGGHQENGRKAGTHNTPGIAAFGAAATAAKNHPNLYQAQIAPIRNKLRQSIIAAIPNTVINGSQTKILPHILNISFPGAEGESILLMLDEAGIEVSTGSACASGDARPSHVLMALNPDPELAHGSIRFSLGLDNTPADIDCVMKHLPGIIKKLRAISTMKGAA